MARPKIIKDGKKLNLYIPAAAKRSLFKIATARGESLSKVVTTLIMNSGKEDSPQ